MIQVNEPVKVEAVFGPQVSLKKFEWHGRNYQVSKVGYQHRFKKGEKLIHAFSGVSGSTAFCLHFNALDLSWRLWQVDEP